ncbi:sodium/potassium/calcium exchanger 1 [Fagus crenata]
MVPLFFNLVRLLGDWIFKRLIVESDKQCNSFKTRANQVKEGLEKGVSGITVLLNPDKPRRGCFEIREECGETFISLLKEEKRRRKNTKANVRQ